MNKKIDMNESAINMAVPTQQVVVLLSFLILYIPLLAK